MADCSLRGAAESGRGTNAGFELGDIPTAVGLRAVNPLRQRCKVVRPGLAGAGCVMSWV